jgi:RimJ/RimL family protein N-acetyltransferase
VFPDSFQTDRLRFERFCHENVDVQELYERISTENPTVDEEMRYLPWSPAATLKDAEERIDAFERSWDRRQRAEWAIRPRSGEDGAGELAGRAGLLCEWEKDLAMPAILLFKPFWGRGYAGERADALLEIAFDRLDVSVVAVPIHRDNERSYRAVEKYVRRHGGRYEGLLRNHAGRYDSPVDHHRFSISNSEYERSRS